jgi:acyl-coenzyme A synthetase/AMP-(fatty) acid ligase/acyl carrier protein
VFDGLRAFVSGGEMLLGSDLGRLLERVRPSCMLINGYGPTECTMALQHRIVPGDSERHSVPIGRPVPGVEIEIEGELALRSPHVLLRYEDGGGPSSLPEHTPEGPRLHRTGDLVRLDPDGALIHAGRKDRQVKLHGHRLEPAEIENLLGRHPAVAEAAVCLSETGDGPPTLVGFAVSSAPRPPEPLALRSYLQRHLPAYAVPSEIVLLPELPRGPSGKTDYRALATADHAAAETETTLETPLQWRIAEVWAEVLGGPTPSRAQSFTFSGGDSLDILALFVALEEEFAVKPDLQGFLAEPTVAWLAEQVERSTQAR